MDFKGESDRVYGTGTRSFSSSNQFKTTTISESLGCLRNRSAEVSAAKIREPSGVMSWFRDESGDTFMSRPSPGVNSDPQFVLNMMTGSLWDERL